MTKDSRAEILIVAGVGLLLLFFWHRNSATQGLGLTTDLSGLPSTGNPVSNSGVPLDLTMPTGFAPGVVLPGITAPAINIGGTSYSLSQPGGCGCGGGNTGVTYGGASDLAGALIAQGYDQPFVGPGESF